MKVLCSCGEEASYFYRIDRLSQVHCRCPVHRLDTKYQAISKEEYLAPIMHVSAFIRGRPRKGATFKELSEQLRQYTSRALVDKLRELELNGIIRRKEEPAGTRYFYVRPKERVLREVMES